MPHPIELPYGGTEARFTLEELINHFRNEKINFIIVGARHVRLDKHPKLKSLDVWLRNHESVAHSYKNTCQAVSTVIYEIIELGNFSIGKGKCPESNKMCKALIFCKK